MHLRVFGFQLRGRSRAHVRAHGRYSILLSPLCGRVQLVYTVWTTCYNMWTTVARCGRQLTLSTAMSVPDWWVCNNKQLGAIGSTFHSLGPLSADPSVVRTDRSEDGGPRQWKAHPFRKGHFPDIKVIVFLKLIFVCRYFIRHITIWFHSEKSWFSHHYITNSLHQTYGHSALLHHNRGPDHVYHQIGIKDLGPYSFFIGTNYTLWPLKILYLVNLTPCF